MPWPPASSSAPSLPCTPERGEGLLEGNCLVIHPILCSLQHFMPLASPRASFSTFPARLLVAVAYALVWRPHLGNELITLVPQLLFDVFVNQIRCAGHTAHRLRHLPYLVCRCRCLTGFEHALHVRQVNALQLSQRHIIRYVSA